MVHGNEFVTEAITVKVPKTLNLSEANTEFKYEPEDWTKGPVKVTIETNIDIESLDLALEYSLNGGDTWTEYTGPVQISNNGMIHARLRDKEDDEEGTYAVGNVGNIDRLAPKAITNFTGKSTDSSITLTGSTEDAEATTIDGSSKIKAYYYSIDDGATWLPQNGTLETSYTFNDLPDTTTYTTLKMKAIDNAGNETITESITVATKKINKPYVGDYVNYTPQTTTTSYTVSATYSGYSKDQTINKDTLKWRILNINDNGTIDLISEDVTTTSFYFKGELGYSNGVYLLNDLCSKLYSNSLYGATARSINIEDIQDKMDLTYWDYRNYVGSGTESYGSTTTITSKAYMKYPQRWAQEISGTNAVDR